MTRPQLNRALVLEQPERAADGAGGFVESWTVVGTLWAEVSLRTGGERAEAGAAISRASFRIVVRGAPAGSSMRPRPEQRFSDGQRLFRIRAVAEHDRAGRYLVCLADEEVAS